MILAAFTFSCRKPTDESLPTVRINTPLAGQFFHVFDTIFVNVKITDDLDLNWLKIDVINEQNVIATGAQVINNFDTLTETVNQPIIIDNIHLETGTYYVRATVSDGTNENYAFQEINIFEAPLERLNILAVSNPTSTSTRVDSLTENGFMEVHQWNQKVNLSVVNSWHREVLLAAETSGDIQMLFGDELLPGDIISGTGNGSNPDYNSIEFHSEFRQYFSSKYLAQIEVFNHGGVTSSTFNSAPGHRPYSIEPINSQIIVEERNLAETVTHVSSYNKSSGALLSSLALQADLVEITHQGDDIWLWGNEESEGKLWLFDQEIGFITETHAFGSALGEIQDIVAVDDGTVGVAFASNSIVVEPGNQPSFGTLWDYGGDEIDYDAVANDFLVRNGDTVYILAPGDNNPHGQFDTPLNTTEILILYNK